VEEVLLSVEDVLLLTTGEQVAAEDKVGGWIAVLRRMDGKTLLGEILTKLGLKQADIRKHLEEALDYGVVVVREEMTA
jgi:hypothetical protein